MRRSRPLLGTFVEIAADGLPPPRLERAIDEAFAAVAQVGRLMSFHDPGSDLSALNRGAVSAPVAVHPWTARVIARAAAIHRATGGLFDCAVASELVRWKLLPDPGGDVPAGTGTLRRQAQRTHALPGPGETSPLETATMAAVRLTADNRVAFDAPLALDLGGIAKGFAVDRAVAVLRRHGVRAAVVNAGGDLRAMGPPVPIHLRDPADRSVVHVAGMLQNGAIATSSAAETLTRCGAVPVSALVRPHTRQPIIDGDAYSVIAGSCLVADALTKVLAQLRQPDAPVLARFGAVGIITKPGTSRRTG